MRIITEEKCAAIKKYRKDDTEGTVLTIKIKKGGNYFTRSHHCVTEGRLILKTDPSPSLL